MIMVNRKLCDLCGTCVSVCAADAIFIDRHEVTVKSDKCVECGSCVRVCPTAAISEDK